MAIMISNSHEMKAFQGFVLYFSNFKVFPGFSRFSRFSRSAGNPAKWSNTQIIRRQLPPNFLNVSDHFVGLALIVLTLWPVWITCYSSTWRTSSSHKKSTSTYFESFGFLYSSLSRTFLRSSSIYFLRSQVEKLTRAKVSDINVSLISRSSFESVVKLGEWLT